MEDEKDPLRQIMDNAYDLADRLQGLESTARIVSTLGFNDDAPDIETEDVANMMSSFMEQFSRLRDSATGIAHIADVAMLDKLHKIKAVK